MAEIDIAALRRRLKGTGREYWRSLEDLADSPEFLELLEREFPRQAAAMFEGGVTDLDRRGFLRLMGASFALAGLGACTRQPTEKIVPYVKSPEQIVPGEPLFYATAMPLGGAATGLLVESHTGRPTKVEGNPSHPASLGATDAYAQASVLTLYDPDRSQVVRRIGEIVPWSEFEQALATLAETARSNQGAGLRILSGTVSSPTLAAQMRELTQSYPRARWHQYDPVSGGARAGARAAFGRDADVLLRLERADSILALDSDFLVSGRGAVRHARDFASRRKPRREAAEMSRLWVVESSPTPTGTRADERLALPPRQIGDLARALASRLGLELESPPSMELHRAWIDALAADLRAHAGRSAVIVGDQQPAELHALGHAMNERLGNLGTTVVPIEPIAAQPVDPIADLRELVTAMSAGEVELLLIVDSNPVYEAPADLDFVGALERVRTAVSLGLYDDETAVHCHWHVPMAHYLESWGDARAFDGTVTLLQPLIAPLYDGKTASELLEVLLGRPPRSAYELVREHWQKERSGAAFETFWARSLNDGVVDGTTSPTLKVALQGGWREALAESPAAPEADRIEALFRPDRKVLDGRFANNAWLQELPDALTKLTWDNAALIAPALGERLGLRNGDVVELELGGRIVAAPVWLTPGHADGCATLPLGYGRTRAGRVGDGVGFDAYRLRTSNAPDQAPGLAIRKTGERRELACTQAHGALEGRPILRSGDLDEFRENPAFAQELGEDPPLHETLYPNYPYEGHSWGMAVDLNACVGCNACIVACQSENNIAVVGRDQVAMGREMHWIRLDRYYSGPVDAPETHFQPMLCQHCERAPCEVVCPVNATVHDGEGLNVMVYNRCVGTRYCSNNCPYKVRRFNFYLYSDWTTESLKLQRNPNVTVRSRGVMEKCTYCVQRISRGRIASRRDGRPLEDGAVRTACQQVCPADAIYFGDLNDPESRVVRAKSDPRNYSALAELNTRPRTTYLAEVRNPDPKLRDEEDA